MKKKTTRPKPKRKLDSIEQAVVAAASMPVPKARKAVAQLAKQICPSPPPKPKFTPRFRARFLAFCASQDLKAFAGWVHMAALIGDKLFFKYLAEYLEKKPKWLPISEGQRKLLQLQKPRLSASEALEELPRLTSKGHYRTEKKRALERSELLTHLWRKGWIDNLQ
jgi:hypothetical protein